MSLLLSSFSSLSDPSSASSSKKALNRLSIFFFFLYYAINFSTWTYSEVFLDLTDPADKFTFETSDKALPPTKEEFKEGKTEV
jgi:hypothetical protein